MKKSAAVIERALQEAALPMQEVAKLESCVRVACHAVLRAAKADLKDVTCDFCQRPRAKVDFLVEGPLCTICDECIIMAQMAVDEYRAKKKPQPAGTDNDRAAPGRV